MSDETEKPVLIFEELIKFPVNDRRTLQSFLDEHSQYYSKIYISNSFVNRVKDVFSPIYDQRLTFKIPVEISVAVEKSKDLVIVDVEFYAGVKVVHYNPIYLSFSRCEFRKDLATEGFNPVKILSRYCTFDGEFWIQNWLMQGRTSLQFLECDFRVRTSFNNVKISEDLKPKVDFQGCRLHKSLKLENVEAPGMEILVYNSYISGGEGSPVLEKGTGSSYNLRPQPGLSISNSHLSMFRFDSIRDLFAGIRISGSTFQNWCHLGDLQHGRKEKRFQKSSTPYTRNNEEPFYLIVEQSHFAKGCLFSTFTMHYVPATTGSTSEIPPEFLDIKFKLISSPEHELVNLITFRQFCKGGKNAKFSDQLKRLELYFEGKTSTSKTFRFLSNIYRLTSNYGFSAMRPLAAILFSVPIFALVFALLSDKFVVDFIPDYTSMLTLSFTNTFPVLPIFTEMRNELIKEFFGTRTGFWFPFFGFIQSALNLMFMFLTGLGLRNLFKLSG